MYLLVSFAVSGENRPAYRADEWPTALNVGLSRQEYNPATAGGIAPNQVIARSELEGHRQFFYGVNVTKAVIGAYI